MIHNFTMMIIILFQNATPNEPHINITLVANGQNEEITVIGSGVTRFSLELKEGTSNYHWNSDESELIHARIAKHNINITEGSEIECFKEENIIAEKTKCLSFFTIKPLPKANSPTNTKIYHFISYIRPDVINSMVQYGNLEISEFKNIKLDVEFSILKSKEEPSIIDPRFKPLTIKFNIKIEQSLASLIYGESSTNRDIEFQLNEMNQILSDISESKNNLKKTTEDEKNTDQTTIEYENIIEELNKKSNELFTNYTLSTLGIILTLCGLAWLPLNGFREKITNSTQKIIKTIEDRIGATQAEQKEIEKRIKENQNTAIALQKEVESRIKEKQNEASNRHEKLKDSIMNGHKEIIDKQESAKESIKNHQEKSEHSIRSNFDSGIQEIKTAIHLIRKGLPDDNSVFEPEIPIQSYLSYINSISDKLNIENESLNTKFTSMQNQLHSYINHTNSISDKLNTENESLNTKLTSIKNQLERLEQQISLKHRITKDPIEIKIQQLRESVNSGR